MDKQELIILFVVGIIAILALVIMYSNMKPTGEAVYTKQVIPQSGASCYTNAECYWTYNSLKYECRAGICKPKGAIGPPQYEARLKIR